MESLIITLYIIFSLLLIWEASKEYKKNKLLSIKLFFIMIYLSIYGIVPAVYYQVGYFDISSTDYLVYFLIVLSYVAVNVGLQAGDKVPLVVFREGAKDRKIHFDKALYKYAWILLFISISSFFVYSLAYGGILSAFNHAREIRAGTIDISNPWSFLRTLTDFSLFSSYLFFSLMLSKNKGNELNSIVGFLLSFFVSIVVLLFSGGRLYLMLYLLVFIISYNVLKKNRIRLKHFIFLLLGAVFLYYAEYIFYSVRYHLGNESLLYITPPEFNLDTVFDFYLSQLSFIYHSIFVSIDSIANNIVQHRFLSDFFVGMYGLLPNRWFPMIFDDISHIHTSIANPHGLGTIPIDIVSYGIYSFGIVYGPIITSFLYGLVTKLVQRYVQTLNNDILANTLLIAHIIFLSRSLIYFTPTDFVNDYFYLLSGTIILFAFKKENTDTDKLPALEQGSL